ncbi:hypothetical protein Rhe02_30130 [Rhizocola hellebori]|uniref:Glycosyltransferase n=1 Tax=Rhizocola hellebori TaxID=1392758 RepID=A0A8J3VGD0_9ACTN|nr:hypothetical protein [Rhizocola hellebori]GIH04946.1 hypothetical protein Rhe02_30130 [Rhizocola hellebori]
MQANPALWSRAMVALGAAALVTMLAVDVPAVANQDDEKQHSAHDQGKHQDTFVPRTRQQVAFHDDMRKLWEDHVTWTRLAIVTFADGAAGFDATAARLLANQADIGNAIKRFYGGAAGQQLTALLREHILTAVELLQAAKAGDTPAFEAARIRWYANANEISDFLSAANPRWWPRDTMRAAMRAHLDQTLAEAAHEIGGDHAASVADYEPIHAHILMMADLLSSGIMRQFPHLFH